MKPLNRSQRREAAVVVFFTILTLLLIWWPTGFENRIDRNAVRCRGEILATDNSNVQQMGIVKDGQQSMTIRLLNGPFKGRTVPAVNQLLGKMELDKIYSPGDVALVVLTLDGQGEIAFANPQDHYRLRAEWALFLLFAALLLFYGRWTGAKALLSFVFTALAIWKILVPMFLKGYDPVMVALIVITILTIAIVLLVGGWNRRGAVACLGAFAGILTTGLLAWVFTDAFKLHGAVRPFAETLLYSGYAHLDLKRIFMAGVFIASAGAMMDLAMDVAASLDEISFRHPDLSRRELIMSGLRIGRAVSGTMTTTLLFAYSGGYVTLLMVFMAQGVPLANLFNLIYVTAEVLNTLVGSFGLIMVAPFTALIGGLLYSGRPTMAAAVPSPSPLLRTEPAAVQAASRLAP